MFATIDQALSLVNGSDSKEISKGVSFFIRECKDMISISFNGSKRNWVKDVNALAKENKYKEVLEPFGGSGVLSVNLFNEGLVDTATINDYDKTFDIYKDYLVIKEELVSKLINAGFVKSKEKLCDEQRKFLQKQINNIDKKYWRLLANNFVFSAVRTGEITVKNFVYFMSDTTTNKQKFYFDVVEKIKRDSCDYVEFINKYVNKSNQLVILDPPYLNSSQKSYCNQTFFSVKETVEVLKSIKVKGNDFIFFNSDIEDMRALLNLFGLNVQKFLNKRATTNNNNYRNECMFYVKQVTL